MFPSSDKSIPPIPALPTKAKAVASAFGSNLLAPKPLAVFVPIVPTLIPIVDTFKKFERTGDAGLL